MLLLSSACVRHSDMQGQGEEALQGVWIQDSSVSQAQMLEYTLHEFRFVCDSVYITMHVNSRIQRIADSCYGGGQWTEYAKAVYDVRGDSVIVDGVYTKPDGKQKVSGCHRHGRYTPRYYLSVKSKDSVVLENRFEGRPIVLRKTADVECVPKRRWEL